MSLNKQGIHSGKRSRLIDCSVHSKTCSSLSSIWSSLCSPHLVSSCMIIHDQIRFRVLETNELIIYPARRSTLVAAISLLHVASILRFGIRSGHAAFCGAASSGATPFDSLVLTFSNEPYTSHRLSWLDCSSVRYMFLAFS